MTLAELQAYVLDRLSISSSDTARVTMITTILNQEYLRVVQRYQINGAVSDVAFVADDPVVDLPDDLAQVVSLRCGDVTLQPVTMERYAQLLAGSEENESGLTPRVYAFEAPYRIRVYPTPATTDLTGAVLYYLATPAVLAGGSDEPSSLPTEFHLLLAERAVEIVALAEEEVGLSQGAGMIANRLEQQLQDHMNVRAGRGDLRIRREYLG